jgi:hypothetical protein
MELQLIQEEYEHYQQLVEFDVHNFVESCNNIHSAYKDAKCRAMLKLNRKEIEKSCRNLLPLTELLNDCVQPVPEQNLVYCNPSPAKLAKYLNILKTCGYITHGEYSDILGRIADKYDGRCD